MKYPTLRKCLQHMIDHELKSERPCIDAADTAVAWADFERWLRSRPRDLLAVELELSKLSIARLRRACTTEPGTVSLSWAADSILEQISNCIYCPEDPTADPEGHMFCFGLLAGYYQTEYQEVDWRDRPAAGFEGFYREVLCGGECEFAFFEGYMHTRKYGMEGYNQVIAMRS